MSSQRSMGSTALNFAISLLLCVESAADKEPAAGCTVFPRIHCPVRESFNQTNRLGARSFVVLRDVAFCETDLTADFASEKRSTLCACARKPARGCRLDRCCSGSSC